MTEDFEFQENGIFWTVIDRPVGPQALPTWIADAHINWMDGYGNSPSVTFKTRGDPSEWEGKRWRRESKGDYFAEHEDGRLDHYFHRGQLARRKIEMYVDFAGNPHVYRPLKSGWPRRTVDILATTQEDGYAGRAYQITMESGETALLRGPWYGLARPGYMAFSYVDLNASWRVRPVSNRWRRPWFEETACFGLYMRVDAWIAALARFCPEIELALVKRAGMVGLEPFKPEWGVPKCVVHERKRQAFLASQSRAAE